jgi:hypothetical protein
VLPSGTSLRVLGAKALICGVVMCHAQSYSTSASGISGQTIPAANGGNPFAGSVPTKLVAGRMPLSLQDAINLGLKHNLGLLLSRADTRAARGQRWQELSALLPHVSAAPYVAESKVNIAEAGLGGVISQFHIPPAVGPFSYFDARAAVTQTLFDWKSIRIALHHEPCRDFSRESDFLSRLGMVRESANYRCADVQEFQLRECESDAVYARHPVQQSGSDAAIPANASGVHVRARWFGSFRRRPCLTHRNAIRGSTDHENSSAPLDCFRLAGAVAGNVLFHKENRPANEL